MPIFGKIINFYYCFSRTFACEYKYYYLCLSVHGRITHKVKIFKVYSLKTLPRDWKNRTMLPSPRSGELELNSTKEQVKRRGKTWDTPGLQLGGWYSLADPSPTLHERGKPGDVDTGSRRHGSWDTRRFRKNNGGDRRQLGKFDLFSADIREIDLGSWRTKDCSILEGSSAPILQSVECAHDQLLEKIKSR